MKRSLSFLLFLWSVLAVLAQSDKPFYELSEGESKKLKAELLYKKQLYDQNIDVRHVRLQLDIDPDSDSISGWNEMTFEWREAPFDQVFLDFSKAGMHIDSIVDGGGQRLSFTHNVRHLVDIRPGRIAEKGEVEQWRIYFSGKPEQAGKRSFTYQLHGRPGDVHRVAATLSQPYGARDWWPCRDNLSDKIDSLDMRILVPPGMLAAGLGKLVQKAEGVERDTFEWSHRHPVVSYLVAVAVTNYNEYSDWYVNESGDSLQILNYVFPVNDSLARSQTPVITEMMGVFEKLFGPYPFFSEKYGHAQFVFSGGMEHQTMSFMGNFNFDLQAHELAHQWFGNTITCGSWQDIWLNEGFATYLTMLCHEHLRGDSAFQAGMNLMRNRIMREPDGSVVVPAEDTLNVSRVFSGRLSYEKGAWVLHMLRFVLGDEAFYRGLNDYFYAQRHHHGFVSTEDLRIALESASGQDLDGFFNQWVYGQGYPQFDLRWQAQSNQLSIQLTQRTSTPVWDYFDIPVPVLLRGEGKDSLILLRHGNQIDSFQMVLPFRIEELIADPYVQILARVESIRQQSDDQKIRIEVFPNPASEILRVQSDSIRFSTIRILNLQGALLHEENLEKQGIGSWSYSLNSLSGGLYFLEILTEDNRRVVQRFIRE